MDLELEAKLPMEQQSHMQIILKDLTAGTIAGIANVLSGHPLDTMKVRMQMLKTSFTSCIKDITAKEGIKAFYKGVTSPLYSVPAINALVFGAYELGRRFLATGSEMTINKVFLAGAWTGIVSCVIFTPVELIKCRQQMEGVGSKIKTTATLTMMKQVFQKEGIRGLYKGNLIALLAVTPSYSTQFGSYEIAKGALSSKIKDTQMVNLIAGGIAGLACWVVCYPQDLMKTKIQCDVGPNGGKYPHHKYIRDGGIINCAKDIYRHEGYYGFWKGFSACTVRAILANACMFFAYEEAQIFLNSGSNSF